MQADFVALGKLDNSQLKGYKLNVRLISHFALLVLLLASALMPTVVEAADGCEGGVCGTDTDLSPSSGTVGSQVTLSLESGVFPLDGDYEIWWSKWATFPTDDRVVVAEGNVATGGYQVTATFTVPEAIYGTNYIQFVRRKRPDDPVNLIFNVLPGIKVSPSPAPPRSTVTITGCGFSADDVGELSFDGKVTDVAIATDELGSFTAEFTIPDTIAGEHKFKVTAEDLYNKDATTALDIVPSISLDPEFPDVGAEVTVTGHGFAANSEVSIEFDAITITSSPASDEVGNFTTTLNIPESPEAEHKIIATDQAGNMATLSLPLEGKAPPPPATISPKGQRFGWFGSQPVTFSWTEVADPSGITYTSR